MQKDNFPQSLEEQFLTSGDLANYDFTIIKNSGYQAPPGQNGSISARGERRDEFNAPGGSAAAAASGSRTQRGDRKDRKLNESLVTTQTNQGTNDSFVGGKRQDRESQNV